MDKKKSRVKSHAMGSKPDLWKAVRVAKDLNVNEIPSNLTLGGVPVQGGDIAGSFAGHFHDKIDLNASRARVVPGTVYNGKCKLIVQNRNFMTRKDVLACLSDLNNKKCEGFDRIPVCVLFDAKNVLLTPFTKLFDKIYSTGKIPDQWKVSKIIPIFKKGSKTEIENYRPVANLCSTSKIFEKLILKQIHYLENTNKLDLTGKQQHGFKRKKSTATAGALLQSH